MFSGNGLIQLQKSCDATFGNYIMMQNKHIYSSVNKTVEYKMKSNFPYLLQNGLDGLDDEIDSVSVDVDGLSEEFGSLNETIGKLNKTLQAEIENQKKDATMDNGMFIGVLIAVMVIVAITCCLIIRSCNAERLIKKEHQEMIDLMLKKPSE